MKKKVIELFTTHPARFFFWATPIWGAVMCILNYIDGTSFSWHDLLVEANGMLLDLVVFGILLTIYQASVEKSQRIERYLEEINDYRGWDEKEASYRIYGIVKRLCKDGVKQLNLSWCNLSRQNLSNINLINPNFHKANLSSAWLSKISLAGANLSGANLSGANLSGANLHKANLKGANLSNANLIGATLSNANLIGSNLIGADLSSADLSGANLTKAILSTYQSEHWLRLELQHEEPNYSDDTSDDFYHGYEDTFYNNNVHYRGADLNLANLTGAILTEANLNYVNLEKANLTGAKLFRSELLGADLRCANLFGANLTEADLSDVELEGAIVRDTWLERIVSNRVYANDEILEKYSLIEDNGNMLLKKKK